MNMHIIKRRSLQLMLASLIVVMTGCDITSVRDAVDDFDLIIQLEPIETYVVAQIVDAETGDLVDGSIQVAFSGPDASSVIDFYSDPVTALSVRGGMLTVGVHQGIAPAESSPVRFSVTATADDGEPESDGPARTDAPIEVEDPVVVVDVEGDALPPLVGGGDPAIGAHPSPQPQLPGRAGCRHLELQHP